MVTFKKPIGSVSVSGHKFVGAPVPCGVVITRMRYVMALSRWPFIFPISPKRLPKSARLLWYGYAGTGFTLQQVESETEGDCRVCILFSASTHLDFCEVTSLRSIFSVQLYKSISSASVQGRGWLCVAVRWST